MMNEQDALNWALNKVEKAEQKPAEPKPFRAHDLPPDEESIEVGMKALATILKDLLDETLRTLLRNAHRRIEELEQELNDRDTYCKRLKAEYAEKSRRATAIAAMIGGLPEPELVDSEQSYPAQGDSEPAHAGFRKYYCGHVGDIRAEDAQGNGILMLLRQINCFMPGPDPEVSIDKESGRITITTPYDEE